MVYERYLPLTLSPPPPQKKNLQKLSFFKILRSKILAEFVTFRYLGFFCFVYTTRESVTQDKNIAKLTNENFNTKDILR